MNTGIISRMKKSASSPVKGQLSNVPFRILPRQSASSLIKSPFLRSSASSPRQSASSLGFTLLELLIVIAIIAILSVALILVLNPAETLKKSRDAQRISDMSTIKTALGLYLTSTTTPWLNGNTNAACDTAWRSSTTTNQTGTLTDGATTNWIPVNLNSLTSGSPISNLPLDPINIGIYGYTYKCNNTTKTFKITAALESDEYTTGANNKLTTDGGTDTTRYEVGTNLQLSY